MLKVYLLCAFLFTIGHGIMASHLPTDTVTQKRLVRDSITPDYAARMQALALKLSKESNDDLAADQATIAQDKAFEKIKGSLQKAAVYLKKGVDTVTSAQLLQKIDRDLKIANDGVLVNKGTAQTFRNLTATAKIISELSNMAAATRNMLSQHHQKLTSFRLALDSLSNDPVLFKFPKDSADIAKYLQHLVVVAYQVHPVDSSLKATSDNVRSLLNRVDMVMLKLQTSLDEVRSYQQDIATSSLKREFGNIWDPVGYSRPFSEILKQARAKGLLTLSFYLQNNIGKVMVLLLLLATSVIYIRSLKNIYLEQGLLKEDSEGQLVLKSPFLSALLIVISIFQFIFISPPFSLDLIFWTVCCISLSLMFKGYITKYWMNVWLMMVVLFLITAGDNLILQATRAERWFMLALATTGMITGCVVILKGRKEELREQWIVHSITFMAVLEFGSMMLNVFGRYNLSKTFLISGYLNVVIAILFLWTVRLINEGLFLAFNVYQKQDRKLFYLNFQRVGSRAPLILYVVMVIGWFILFARNFAGFDQLLGPVRDVFGRERTLGDYTFSINNLLLFIAIMGISVLVSKIVSFFASDDHIRSGKGHKNDKRGIGSWLLLVRISILSIGLFLAVAAAGIPVDRITIVIGALGVGIGFGLQTLVNNLVSGLIIAFEKPVNVGDVVEVGGQGGTMRSIGFRSSVISTWEGADVVMPNGDLLSAHLTNWSLAGDRKRMSILVGIAYDADLEKAKELLIDLAGQDERVSQDPAPVVQYEQFNSSSIDIRVYFWTKHMRDSFATRSDLIMAITSAFAENGIVIPFPQQELRIYQQGQNNDEHKGGPKQQ